MIRELAENPNVHQSHAAGLELHRDPGGRFALFLAPGRGPRDATVQRVRVGAGAVLPLLEEVRGLLRERGRQGAEWELGESCTPPDLVRRLLDLGLTPIEDDPVATGMVLRGEPAWEAPPGVVARRVESEEELGIAHGIQNEAFGAPAELDPERIEQRFAREGVDGSTFVAWVDGLPAAAGYAAYTDFGLILFGGATLPAARGRGAYRALVAARAAEAADRGAPAVVTQAGQMSRPILERLGFEPVARIDRLLDVLADPP